MSKKHTYFHIPLLHRTSLESAMMGTGDGNGERGGRGVLEGLSRPKHRALRFTVCMEEEVTLTLTAPSSSSSASFLHSPTVNSSSLRNTSFDLCLSDMTYRFDPSSLWFQYFPAIFDPIGSTDIVPGTESACDNNNSYSDASRVGTSAGISSMSSMSSPTVSVFGRTRLNLSVSKLMIDCCQPDRTEEQLQRQLSLTKSKYRPSFPGNGTNTSADSCTSTRKKTTEKMSKYQQNTRTPSVDSRILLSLGRVSVSSTLVTNSNRVALSATVTDASVRVSNKLLRTPPSTSSRVRKINGPVSRCIEQSPVDILGYYIEETYQLSSTKQQQHYQMTDDLTIDFDSYVDVHGLVLMGSLDRCAVKIHLNTPSQALAAARHRLRQEQATLSNMSNFDLRGGRDVGVGSDVGRVGGLFGEEIEENKEQKGEGESDIIPISVECSLGTAVVYGCADSLLVLVVSPTLPCFALFCHVFHLYSIVELLCHVMVHCTVSCCIYTFRCFHLID